jgi:Fe-Mn family superoxide dismutase
MNKQSQYIAKDFNLSGLRGISDKTLEIHFGLYQGYVRETNRLNEMIAEFLTRGKVDREQMPAYSELKRRLGFEYNGMVLHEYYFLNLKKNGGGEPARDAAFRKAAETSFGDFDTWKSDFVSLSSMRGVGWAVCYQDPENRRLSNHWISLHEIGNIAGFAPVLVMDLWEHAYLLDYKPAERGKYVEAFFANVDWEVVERRLRQPAPGATRAEATSTKS